MKARRTLILLALALAFGGYLVFWEARQELPSDEPGVKRSYLFNFTAADAQNVTIAVASDAPVELSKDGESWNVSQTGSGKNYKADHAQVADYLETLRGIEATGIVEEGSVDLNAYGLVDPARKIVIQGKTGETSWEYSLLLGDETPVGSRRYVTTKGASAVYVLESYQVGQLTKGVSDFRPRDLLHFDRSAVSRVEFAHHAGEKVVLEREGEEWKLLEPAMEPANREKVDNFLDALGRVRVSEFTDKNPSGDLSGTGLKSPSQYYRLLGGDGTEIASLKLGDRKNGDTGDYFAIASGQPEVVLVSAFSLDDLPRTVDSLKQEAAPAAEPLKESGESLPEESSGEEASPAGEPH